MLNKWQVKELARCKASPVYFVNKYGWINHLKLGPIRFITWDWQDTLLTLWSAWKPTIVLKSRQMGFSWTYAAWGVWLSTFRPNFNILLLSANQEKAIKLLEKFTFFRDNLPNWMKSPAPTPSKASFSQFMRYYDETDGCWKTGDGQIASLTTTGVSGAGDSATAVFVDEFALMVKRGNDEEVWAAIAPTTLHGGLMVTGSTPRQSKGQYYRNWNDSIEPLMNDGIINDGMGYREWNRAVLRHASELDVVPMKIHYSMCYHNEAWLRAACRGMSKSRACVIRNHFKDIKYDEEWKKSVVRRLKLNEQQANQELELMFDQQGGQAFDSSRLEACYVPGSHSSLVKMLARSSEHYYIGIDTAEGITAKNKDPDFNSIVVFNDKGVQVLGLHNQENLDEWAGTTLVDEKDNKTEKPGTVYKTILAYRPCTVINEKNGPGATVANRVEPLLANFDDVEFFSLPMSTKKPKFVGDTQLALADEQIAIVGNEKRKLSKIIITDFKTYISLRNFLKIGPGKFGAAPGFIDDPVIAALWAIQAMKMREAYNSQGALAGQDQVTDAARRELIERGGNNPFGRLREDPQLILPPRRKDPFSLREFSTETDGRRFGGRVRQFGGNNG